MNKIIVIPARLKSSRLPNKLLLDKTGYPLIWHTIQSALRSQTSNTIIVATEDEEIEREVNRFNLDRVRVVMTPECESGTERVKYVADRQLLEYDDVVVNWQGDEPELNACVVDDLIDMMLPSYDVVTLATRATYKEYRSPNVVKVVLRHDNCPMYFSRSPIPYMKGKYVGALKHCGIYVFRYQFIAGMDERSMRYTSLSSESLEQLRWLQDGARIYVECRDVCVNGIDTDAEYRAFVERWNQR